MRSTIALGMAAAFFTATALWSAPGIAGDTEDAAAKAQSEAAEAQEKATEAAEQSEGESDSVMDKMEDDAGDMLDKLDN
jgi:hypothetical protein